MALKLGGEYELVDVEIRTSTIVARKLFLNLIWEMKPEVVIDLVRLFNVDSIPDRARVNGNPINLVSKFFILHTKYHQFYVQDLRKAGFKRDVRQTPVLAYFDFIFRNQGEYDALVKRSEAKWNEHEGASNELIARSALEEFIPNWKDLKSRKDSKWLCSELKKWAEKWNLKNEWCLDFALECLREFKVKSINRLRVPENYLDVKDIMPLWEYNRFWNRGLAWHYAMRDINLNDIRNHLFTDEIPNYPELSYSWKLSTEEETQEIFSITEYYNPLVMFAEDFRRDMEEQFWSKFVDFFALHKDAFVRNSKQQFAEIYKFQRSVENYISKAEKAVKPFATETISKNSGDKHFRWLIQYQIPPIKSYNNLSKESNVDRRAVMDGIKNASKLIGISLRPPLKGGRKKGATDLVRGQRRRQQKILR